MLEAIATLVRSRSDSRRASSPSGRITIESMSDPLLRYRSEFPILERTNYLISNSLGAMPRAVYDALKGYADMWATRGVRAWEARWWMLAAELGAELDALRTAPAGRVPTHRP